MKADRLRQRAAKLRAQAAPKLAEAAAMEAIAAEMEQLENQIDALAVRKPTAAPAHLTSSNDSHKLYHVTPTELSVAIGRKRSRALAQGHPFVVWLYGRTPPMTVATWARTHGLPVPTVSKWVTAKGVPIRRTVAEIIARESKGRVPATEAVWQNGIYDR